MASCQKSYTIVKIIFMTSTSGMRRRPIYMVFHYHKNLLLAIEVELEESLDLAGNLSVQHIIGEKGTSSLEV
jgi:hypothetical protein